MKIKTKSRPWVLIISHPQDIAIINAFAKYANVVTWPVDCWDNKHMLHRIPGSLSSKGLPRNLARFLSVFVNQQHKINLQFPDPEMFDLIFVTDPVICRFDFRRFKNAIKAYWTHDSLLESIFNTQIMTTRIQAYDYVFVIHKRLLQKFKEIGVNRVHWLPAACDPSVHKRLSLPYTYDTAFVGTVNGIDRRKEIVSCIREYLPQIKLFVGNAWLHDMTSIYNKSKIILNVSRYNEVNWRVFEALGCGRLLLSDYNEEIHEIFTDKLHLVFYRSPKELVELIQYYLTHDDEREKIALNGMCEVISKHTLDKRVEEVLATTGLI